jgi:hypothetical protein
MDASSWLNYLQGLQQKAKQTKSPDFCAVASEEVLVSFAHQLATG